MSAPKAQRLAKWLEQVDSDALPWGPFRGEDAAHTMATLILTLYDVRREVIRRGARNIPDCNDATCRYAVCRINRALTDARALFEQAFE